MTAAAKVTTEPMWAHVDDLYRDGGWHRAHARDRLTVTDPATGKAWGSVPDADASDIDAVMASASAAFRDGPWPRMSAAERAAVMRTMADEVEARALPMGITNTRENGSPISETGAAGANAAGILRYFASLVDVIDGDDERDFPAGGRDAYTIVRRDPIGPCVLIAPWNFPINLMVIKLAPALLAGCTVVMKPAESTPLSIRYVVEAAAAAGVPAGVVNLITGAGRVGDALVRDPRTAKVAFTGSTPIGRRIAATCGELLKPVTLELGGKSSAVVLPDADLDAMRRVLIRSSMRNTGQTCYIATRILAPAQRYDEVVDMITNTVAQARQGDPMDSETVFGPVAGATQAQRVMEFLESARAEGARVTTGGNAVDGDGYFIEPTVLADVTADMRVAREEIFGPVITVLRYNTVDEAVALANNTDFGLGGLVFSSDPIQAQQVAERMDTGSVGINFFASNHAAPFGGRHDSGLGVEYGIEGLSAYLTYKSIHRKR